METLNMLAKVQEQYDTKGLITEFAYCPNGHINDTYRVKCKIDERTYKEYIFQKVNTYVFKEPVKIMHNIKEISHYLEPRFSKNDCKIRTFLENKNGENYTCLNDSFWRVCPFIDHSVTYETVEDPKVLCSAGYAFGRFQYLLSDFPLDRLYHTIPDFHNTRKRMQDFFNIVEQDPMGRAKGVGTEIAFFETHRGMASKLVEMLENGELPLRVTHNDTKYNNILMHEETCEPLCVIDLDTVMPGLSMYDFGDAIRFAANTSIEDETDLSRVGLNMDNYKEFTKGFICASKDFLTKKELDNMALGAIVITIELASRFLADYINGDKYFRIHREDHNLDRARCQIKLAQDMMAKYDDMCSMVNMYCNTSDYR